MAQQSPRERLLADRMLAVRLDLEYACMVLLQGTDTDIVLLISKLLHSIVLLDEARELIAPYKYRIKK